MTSRRTIPPEVRAAIAAFLDECQNEARPFAVTEALGAIRAIFTNLDISDLDLEEAISSEAAAAGFDIDYDSRAGQAKIKRKALERWDNEGGAIGKTPPKDAQQRIDHDTDGARRQAKATKDRNRLI